MIDISLTAEQRRAATTIDRSVGIIANAGSGKTRVLVERVAHILAAESLTLRKILVVTFTEKAAQELKSRLASRLPDRRLELMTASITTFHGLATRVLRDHAPLLGLSPSFRILGAGEAAALLQRAVEETLLDLLGKKDPNVDILCRRFKFRSLVRHMIPLLEDRWSFEQYIELGRGDEITAAIISVFRCISARYRSLKIADESLDFHDLEIFTWKLFRDDLRILSDYQRQFRHILVDEFQDTNPLQAKIVRQLFTPPDNILCIVGDPKQSIYRFRRADVSCFSEMLATIMESFGETITLPDNFRSTPGIVRFVNAASQDIPHYTPLVARTAPLDDTAVVTVLISCEAKADNEQRRICEAGDVAAVIPQLSKRHNGYGAIACLFQTRATLQIWADTFRKNGIPIHIYSNSGFWERPEIRALLLPLHVLAGLITNRPSEKYLLAMLISPLFSVPMDNIYRWMKMMPLPKSILPPLHNAVFSHSALGARLRDWQDAAATHTPYELMNRIVCDTDYLRTLLRQDPGGQAASNVESLLRRTYLIGRSRAISLPALLDQMVALQEMDDHAQDSPATVVHDDAVQMMTVHAAKGNEFPVVVLADLFRRPRTNAPAWLFEPGIGFAVRKDNEFANDPEDSPEWGSLREQYLEEGAAERRRLLYVALTRAKEKLILPVHPDITGHSRKGAVSWHDRLYPIACEDRLL